MSLNNRLSVPSSNSATITPVKKCHTLKVQLIICWASLQILSVICRKGKVHDFRILKESRLPINRETEKLGGGDDGGYQGNRQDLSQQCQPGQANRNKPLSDAERRFNEALSRRRIVIEHVNRRCKIFRITSKGIVASIEIMARLGMSLLL